MISVGRGGQRRAFVIFMGAAAIPVVPLVAQSAPTNSTASTPTNNSATDAIGPEQLRGFSLGGRPAAPPPEQAVTPDLIAPRANRPSRPATRPATGVNTSPPATTPAPIAPPARTARAPEARAQPAPAQHSAPAPPTNSVTVRMPPANPLAGRPTPATDSETPRMSSQPLGPNAPLQSGGGDEGESSLLPWIIGLLMLAAAAVYYAWRSRASQRGPAPEPVLAGGSLGGEALALPRELEPRSFPPAPPPAREPAPRPAALVGGITVKRPDAFARPAPSIAPAVPVPRAMGIVSTRLRPQLEIEFEPARAVIDEGQASVHFDVVVTNNGSAPARQLLVEACMINAGPDQDAELRRFFDAPVGQGDRIDSIPPLGRVSLKSAVALPLDEVRAYEVGGRKLFVPLIAFNALYEWGSGQGQSSAAFILGRSSGGDVEGEGDARMAPLRLDLGPRTFGGLEGRRHPLGLKR